MGGKRLTDKEKKEIIADYVICENFSETARRFGISDVTVKRLVENDDNKDMLEKVEQKKEDNTKDTLAYMDSQHETKKRILDKILKGIEVKADKIDSLTNIKDLATAYGIILDKELSIRTMKQNQDTNSNTIQLIENVLKSVKEQSDEINQETSRIHTECDTPLESENRSNTEQENHS